MGASPLITAGCAARAPRPLSRDHSCQGQAIAQFDLTVIVVLQAGLFAIAAILHSACPRGPRRRPKRISPPVHEAARAASASLLAIPLYRRIVLVAALVFGSHAMHDSFAVIRWREAGIGSEMISVLWSELSLRAVRQSGTDEAKIVAKTMRELPVDDFFAPSGVVRADGRLIHDMYLVEVKPPEESRYPWDYYKVLSVIPGAKAFRPLADGKCPLVPA